MSHELSLRRHLHRAIAPGLALLGALSAGACAAAGDPDDLDARATIDRTTPVEPRKASDKFFVVARQDFRKCMWPMCGGVFVAEVNKSTTKCTDNTQSPDCYVAQLDFSALGLDPSVEGTLSSMPGTLLMRGKLGTEAWQKGKFSELVVSAVWKAQTESTATGQFYRVENSGIVCITYPCDTLKETKLNTTSTKNIAGLDLSPTGASSELQAQAWDELNALGLMVAGTHGTTTGPGGTGTTIVASQFYTAVGTNPVPPPTCAHKVCSKGAALDAACSPCAAKVCAADSFCCAIEWDGLCVDAATTLCSDCAAPPACAHPETTIGAKLTPTCSPCAQTVCGQDSFCCEGTWDQLCVNQAAQLCAQ